MRAGQKRNRARALRAGMTDAERVLWRCLRMRQLAGHRFRRQVPSSSCTSNQRLSSARIGSKARVL